MSLTVRAIVVIIKLVKLCARRLHERGIWATSQRGSVLFRFFSSFLVIYFCIHLAQSDAINYPKFKHYIRLCPEMNNNEWLVVGSRHSHGSIPLTFRVESQRHFFISISNSNVSLYVRRHSKHNVAMGLGKKVSLNAKLLMSTPSAIRFGLHRKCFNSLCRGISHDDRMEFSCFCSANSRRILSIRSFRHVYNSIIVTVLRSGLLAKLEENEPRHFFSGFRLVFVIIWNKIKRYLCDARMGEN